VHREVPMRSLVAALVAVLAWLVPSAAGAVTRCQALDRAQKWVDAQVPYSWDAWYTDPSTGICCYRSDCSGLVSAVWGLPAPGHTTYSFAGGPWDDGVTHVIAPSELQPGDALNYPGNPGAGTGHVMLYVSGDFASGWVEVYEEYGHGHPAVRRWRSIDPSIYLPIRFNDIQPCCDEACGNYGCACVDGQCSGGYCPGTGCTAQEIANCGAFGCNCVDHQCNGGYCPGTGCTAKETKDCAAFACDCVDHQCSGGLGCSDKGNGCTAKEMKDCGAYGCGCANHACSGGACGGGGGAGGETGGSGEAGAAGDVGAASDDGADAGDGGSDAGGWVSSGGSISKTSSGEPPSAAPEDNSAVTGEGCSLRGAPANDGYGIVVLLAASMLGIAATRASRAPKRRRRV